MARPEGKALPPGASPAGRYVRVFNLEEEAAPPGGALEPCGYDKENNWLEVRKPTVAGRNDCLFVGRTTIRARSSGQALQAGGAVPALYMPDGTTPAARQLWGTKAGQWALSPQSTGYIVRMLASANRSMVVVEQAPATFKEWVKITGVAPGGDLPATYYPGVVMKLDIPSDTYVESIVTCWWRDVYGEAPDIDEIIDSYHEGNAGQQIDDYRPLYSGRTEAIEGAASSDSSSGGSSGGGGDGSGSGSVEVVTQVDCDPTLGLAVQYGTLSGTVRIGGRTFPVTLRMS